MQSCSKAWEYYGFVSEKDQAYKDAAFYYDKAWKHSNFSSPALGKHDRDCTSTVILCSYIEGGKAVEGERERMHGRWEGEREGGRIHRFVSQITHSIRDLHFMCHGYK